MSAHITLSSQQCKRARAALKWNVQDLSNHTGLSVRQIDRFERNLAKLQRFENDEILSAFDKEGAEFLPNGEVRVKGKSAQSKQTANAPEPKTYNLDAPSTAAASGDESTAEHPPLPRPKIII